MSRKDLDLATSKREAKADRIFHKKRGWKNVRSRKIKTSTGIMYVTSGRK